MIPGYAEALEEERRRRNRVEFQIPDTVCGVQLRPLTLNDVTILQESGVCFFDDSDEAHNASMSLVLLLWWQWVNRPEYPNRGPFLRLRRKLHAAFRRRFARAVGIVSTDTADKDLGEWLKWQFADAPPRKSGPHGSPPPITSFAVSICDSISTRCHWSRSEVMSLPLPVLWQHIKLGILEADPKSPRFNPSDSVKSDFLRKRAHGNN